MTQAPKRNFMDLYWARSAEGKSVCIGLDPDAEKIPVQHLYNPNPSYSLEDLVHAQQAYIAGTADVDDLRMLAKAVLTFNKRIVDATHDLVCAYKPQSAFYEALGEAGIWALDQTVDYINEVAPGVPVILDAKRGDIGNTNSAYVRALSAFDAVTLNPYLGKEAMEPFLAQADLGNIYLVKTSNLGSGEFQDSLSTVELSKLGEGLTDVPEWLANLQPLITIPHYKYVAHQVAHFWNNNGNCAVVVGATYPEQLAEVRRIIGDGIPILNPGAGAQGGNVVTSVRAGVNSRGQGLIVNSAREIIFASQGPDFAEVARCKAQELHNTIRFALASA